MKIVRAMKEVSRLKGEIKEIKKRMSSCLSAVDENDFDENFDELKKTLSTKTGRLIDLKTRIMITNIKYEKFQIILNLGELKSYMDFLRELEPKRGLLSARYISEDRLKYKSQVSVAERNKQIEECQAMINKLTDELDEFNAKTDISESLSVAVQLFE